MSRDPKRAGKTPQAAICKLRNKRNLLSHRLYPVGPKPLSHIMSNEILFYDLSIQGPVRANKCFAPNTLYVSLSNN